MQQATNPLASSSIEAQMEISDSLLTPQSPPQLLPTNVPIAPSSASPSKSSFQTTYPNQRFFTACKDLGSFHLHLRNIAQGNSQLQDGYKLFDVGEEFFVLPLLEEATKKYDLSSQNPYILF